MDAEEIFLGCAELLVDNNQIKQQEKPVQKRKKGIFNRNVMLEILTTFPASFIYPSIIYS